MKSEKVLFYICLKIFLIINFGLWLLVSNAYAGGDLSLPFVIGFLGLTLILWNLSLLIRDKSK